MGAVFSCQTEMLLTIESFALIESPSDSENLGVDLRRELDGLWVSFGDQ